MDVAKMIEEALIEAFSELGIEIVCVYILNLDSGMKVQILIEKLDGAPVSIDDCVKCNRLASTLLDVENFIKKEYTLEISSPGEYRPLTKIRDFERFAGNLVKVELHSPINNFKKFRGKIEKVSSLENYDASILFTEIERKNINELDDCSEILVNFSDIKKATLKKVFNIGR